MGSATDRSKDVDVLLDLPLPRRMASRPVDWIAATMEEGATVPSIETNWSWRFASTLVMPELVGLSIESRRIDLSSLTVQLVQGTGDIFDAALTGERNCENCLNPIRRCVRSSAAC